MPHIYHTQLTEIAADFVEIMRADFERSFDLQDFFRYAQVSLGREVDEMALEEVAFKYFGDHYDLVRWDIGIAWSFIPELEAPEPPGSE